MHLWLHCCCFDVRLAEKSVRSLRTIPAEGNGGSNNRIPLQEGEFYLFIADVASARHEAHSHNVLLLLRVSRGSRPEEEGLRYIYGPLGDKLHKLTDLGSFNDEVWRICGLLNFWEVSLGLSLDDSPQQTVAKWRARLSLANSIVGGDVRKDLDGQKLADCGLYVAYV